MHNTNMTKPYFLEIKQKTVVKNYNFMIMSFKDMKE